MEMNLPVIKLETRNLTKKFSATEGVADISLQVYEHELLTLLGPSGCGKTTILRAIGGFNKIDSGKILLDGAEVQGLPPEKRPTGMVFQSYNHWCSGPPYFCWTSRFRHWTPRSAARCARSSSASSARPG